MDSRDTAPDRAQIQDQYIGARIDETGTLTRQGGVFVLRRDDGGYLQLQLQRMPVDHVEKRVRVIGILVAADIVSVDGVSSA